MPAMVITKMTAMDMPVAVSMRRLTPRKGQLPRNLANRMLLTSIAPTMKSR